MHPTEHPRAAGFIFNVAYVVKRRHVVRVDWALAMAKVMAASKDLKTQTALAKAFNMSQPTISRIVKK